MYATHIDVYCFCVVKMEDLYPIAVSFRFFVPNCGFSHEFGLNSSLEMLARSKQRERDENNKRSSSSFSQRRMMRLCVCILCARYNIIMANENDQFFKVKIYSGTDNFQTTLRQFQRYMEYQIGTKSKSYALHTFCILSAYFIKNIYQQIAR